MRSRYENGVTNCNTVEDAFTASVKDRIDVLDSNVGQLEIKVYRLEEKLSSDEIKY